MADRGPLYTPIEEELPGIYRRDGESWEQIRAYFGPLNTLCREFVLALKELPAWLSPAAPFVHPPGRSDSPTAMESARRQSAVLDEVASWFDFRFEPEPVWRLGEVEPAAKEVVAAKALALRKLPRLMRSRATPTGFLELLCTAFRLDPSSSEQCPVLIEHFAHRPPPVEETDVGLEQQGPETSHVGHDEAVEFISCDSADEHFLTQDEFSWRASLLIPPVLLFKTWAGWRDLRDWVDRHAPTSVWFDLYPVAPSYWQMLVDDVLPGNPDLTTLLSGVKDNIQVPEALHPVSGPQLGVARLPGPEGGSEGD